MQCSMLVCLKCDVFRRKELKIFYKFSQIVFAHKDLSIITVLTTSFKDLSIITVLTTSSTRAICAEYHNHLVILTHNQFQSDDG